MNTLPPDVFRVGDVISVQGPSVPRAWWTRHFRVTAVNDRGLPTLRLLPLDETPEQLATRATDALHRARNRA
jgi:hypothetical protein